MISQGSVSLPVRCFWTSLLNPSLGISLALCNQVALSKAGPRTRQGKEKSKRNALKDGIFSTVAVIEGESRADFENLLDGLREYFLPVGALEEILVEKLAVLFWRERRLLIADGKADIRNNQMDSLGLEEPARWDLLLRYDATLDRAIDRTLNQLERFQRMRLGHPVPPPINVNVSSA
jgi:hypothetical protein